MTVEFAMPPVFRFAPSPNGYLHLGHALSALLNADLVRAAGGRLLLRIEDIDAARCRPEFEAAIYENLAWLGLVWERPVRRQSEHLDDYRSALARLDALGLIYRSFESRAEIAALVAARGASWPRDPDGAPLYPGEAKAMSVSERARRMQAGEPFALRLDMAAALSFLTFPFLGGEQSTLLPIPPPQGGREEFAARAFNLTWSESGEGPDGESGEIAANPAAWGDVILARKDTPTSYHLSVAVDDAVQGVTHVVRGCDLFHATSLHRLLQALLGLPQPIYRHHRLIRDADGNKLSKSTRATALRELRSRGATPTDIRRLVGLD
jgi:glutamyl-Q tRNA(Asp) synthetase